MVRQVLTFGTLYSILLVAGFGLSYLLIGTAPANYTKSEIVGYSVMIVSSVSIYFAIKAVANNPAYQPMGFWQGFWTGVGVSGIGALGFGLYNLFYINYLHPTFIDEYLSYQQQQITTSDASKQQINLQLEELSQYAHLMQNDMLYAGVMFATVFVIGLIFTVVTAAALKQHNQQE